MTASDDPDLVMTASDDPDPVMIQIQSWWSSSDDLDRVMIQIQWWCSMMIQIERWSRSDDEDDLKTKMTWRWDDPADIEKKTSADKLCRVNTFLVKRECWCICNFRMYSSMYLMYCNPMFIPGCIYYVFESCCHAPMFRLGGSICKQVMSSHGG